MIYGADFSEIVADIDWIAGDTVDIMPPKIFTLATGNCQMMFSLVNPPERSE